jgi:hypothetical protein
MRKTIPMPNTQSGFWQELKGRNISFVVIVQLTLLHIITWVQGTELGIPDGKSPIYAG